MHNATLCSIIITENGNNITLFNEKGENTMNNLREYRKEKGYTLKEFAEKVNISCGYACHLERRTRQNPSFDLIKRISIVLDKDIEQIFNCFVEK